MSNYQSMINPFIPQISTSVARVRVGETRDAETPTDLIAVRISSTVQEATVQTKMVLAAWTLMNVRRERQLVAQTRSARTRKAVTFAAALLVSCSLLIVAVRTWTSASSLATPSAPRTLAASTRSDRIPANATMDSGNIRPVRRPATTWTSARSSLEFVINGVSTSSALIGARVRQASNSQRITERVTISTNARSINHTTCAWEDVKTLRDRMPALVPLDIVSEWTEERVRTSMNAPSKIRAVATTRFA